MSEIANRARRAATAPDDQALRAAARHRNRVASAAAIRSDVGPVIQDLVVAIGRLEPAMQYVDIARSNLDAREEALEIAGNKSVLQSIVSIDQ